MRLRGVVLDRDGTLIVERPGWLTEPDQVELLPGAGAALARLQSAGLALAVATNQSAVGRGLLSPDGLEAIHARLAGLLADHGVKLAAVLVCPHAPGSHCPCRKPRPGLVEAAARAMKLSTADCVMVGDALRDMQAGQAAGCAANLLVRSGKGLATEAQVPAGLVTAVVDDLPAAADWMLARCTS